MRLPGQLVRTQMIALVMSCGGGFMGVCGLVVKLGGRVVWAGHGLVLRLFGCSLLDAASRLGELSLYRPIHPPSTVKTVPVT
jgi:hypothetical protein